MRDQLAAKLARFEELERAMGDPAVLGDILSKLKLDPGPILDAARSNDIRVQLRTQTEEAQRLGIFGAPTFVASDGEMFWGNDRLEQALKWGKRGKK